GLLERQGFIVVGTVTTGAEALRQVAELHPDVVLVDIDLGGESGLDVARLLHDGVGAPPVILISTHPEDDYADLIAESPAVGFIPKIGLSAAAVSDMLARGLDRRDGQGRYPR
ncbi:MAG TPA: response regulator, partial [Kineosporiaceae bacterium]|nr:response regulator [Kineosporiaceae bacterium]